MIAGDNVVIVNAINCATPGDVGLITSVTSNGWLKIVLYNNQTISVRNGPTRVRPLASYNEKIQSIFATPESNIVKTKALSVCADHLSENDNGDQQCLTAGKLLRSAMSQLQLPLYTK